MSIISNIRQIVHVSLYLCQNINQNYKQLRKNETQDNFMKREKY